MKTAGIVAEFNPFHNGHAALIHAAREGGATHVAAVMSGNFCQRGSLAVTDKRIRTRCALLGGVDLVLELPLPWATATAQRFGAGAVALLAGTGCVDMLCFGSECGDTAALEQAAGAVDDPALRAPLAQGLEQGLTFARARQLAVGSVAGPQAARLLAHPNNALAVEYLRGARQIGWRPELFTIARRGAAHDAPQPEGAFASASHLRTIALDFSALARFMPAPCAALLEDAHSRGLYAADPAKLETAVLARLRCLAPGALRELPDLSEGLENRLYNAIRTAASLEELYALAKTKRYTLARIRRLVLHAFLGVTARDIQQSPPYLRILGFNGAGREILSRMLPSLPADTRLARLRERGDACRRLAELEERATDLYTLALPRPRPCGYELRAGGVYIK